MKTQQSKGLKPYHWTGNKTLFALWSWNICLWHTLDMWRHI